MFRRKMGLTFLVVFLVMLLATPSAFAAREAKLIFNGQEYKADITIKDGVSYASAKALAKIPGLEVGDDPIVPIRKLFESQGGEVSWDQDNWQVIVSWREKSGDFTADELAVKSSELLKEVNSYKLKAYTTMEFQLEGNEALSKMFKMPSKIEANIEGDFQYEPMAMYIKQTMKLPLEELGISPEEMEAAGLTDEIVTEMVWQDNAIYQKDTNTGVWIYQDLTGIEEMQGFNSLMQITPQQSLEMMKKAGVINVFGEDVVRNGREYYTIKNYIDTESYRSLTEQLLENIDFASLLAALGAQAQGVDDLGPYFQKVVEVMLNSMSIDYRVDTLINKETLLTDYMTLDLEMTVDLKQMMEAIAETMELGEDEKAEIPESPMLLKLKMKVDYQLYDYGVEPELPDLSNAISQEEYIQQLMENMSNFEE